LAHTLEFKIRRFIRSPTSCEPFCTTATTFSWGSTSHHLFILIPFNALFRLKSC
jgi:hypothetical protein